MKSSWELILKRKEKKYELFNLKKNSTKKLTILIIKKRNN